MLCDIIHDALRQGTGANYCAWGMGIGANYCVRSIGLRVKSCAALWIAGTKKPLALSSKGLEVSEGGRIRACYALGAGNVSLRYFTSWSRFPVSQARTRKAARSRLPSKL